MKYSLVDSDDPILHKKTEDLDFTNPSIDPIQFAKDIAEAVNEYKGLGLAANQIGVGISCFVVKAGESMMVFYNPKVVSYSESSLYMDEGCLTYPGLIIKVKRPESIRLRYTLPNGEVETKKFSGMTSRIIQHEMEHLEGKRFYSKATSYHREQGFKKWKKMLRA